MNHRLYRLATIILMLSLAMSSFASSEADRQPPHWLVEASKAPPASAEYPAGGVRELRVGLVLYGGVSLAVYMHGVTKEILNLVKASRARDEGLECRELTGTVRDYCKSLAEMERKQGFRTRISVDVIAGSSAGGINGGILAKSLAHDVTQDPITDLWLHKASVWKLSRGGGLGLLRVLRRNPPLGGDRMYRWIYDALAAMSEEAKGRSLVAPGEQLDLFLTTTDLAGFPLVLRLGDPATVSELEHRGVMHFRYSHDAGEKYTDDFSARNDPFLAFALRATSSFPGVFAPAELAMIPRVLPFVLDRDLQAFANGAFPWHRMAGADPLESYFIDGGVIDNYPFGLVLDSLRRRPTTTEVVRKLVFVQPDSRPPSTRPAQRRPGLGRAIAGGLARYEPIGDELQRLHAQNAGIDRLEAYLAAKESAVRAEMRQAGFNLDDPSAELHDSDWEKLATWLTPDEKDAGYTRIRAEAVIGQMSDAFASMCGFPSQSLPRSFVHSGLAHWSRSMSLTGDAANPERQRDLVRDYDLGYTRRQLLVIGEVLNSLYAVDLSQTDAPTRQDLSSMQLRLSELVESASAVMGASRLPRAFTQRVLKLCPLAEPRQESDANTESWAETHHREIATALIELKPIITRVNDEVERTLHDEIFKTWRSWKGEPRLRLLTAYFGFQRLDLLAYPLRHIAEANGYQRIDPVRISPEDARLFETGGAANKLRGLDLAHFAGFFSHRARENDYLWGRLDSAERLLQALLGVEVTAADRVFVTIVKEEECRLHRVQPLLDSLSTPQNVATPCP